MTNVPEAAEALRVYYALPGNSVGGVVHIIIEDGNTSQAYADWCVLEAMRHRNEDDIRIARMLAGMSRTQRTKLSKMTFYRAL